MKHSLDLLIHRSTQLVQSVIRFDPLAWLISILISFLLQALFLSDPTPIVHPILLGHQADFQRIRRQSQTPIITHSASYHALLPTTPDRSITSLLDLLLRADGKLGTIDPQSIIPSNLSLKTLVAKTRHQLWSLLADSGTAHHETHPRLLIICSDPYLKLLLSSAASTLPIRTILVTPNRSGSFPIEVKRTLESYVDHLSLIISQLSSDSLQELLGPNLSARVLSLQDISHWFQSDQPLVTGAPDQPTQLAKARLITLHHFSQSDDESRGNVKVFEFTPENLLAGITASLGLLPSDRKLDSKDTVTLEFCGDDLVWGNEISFAIAALYAGADVHFFDGLKHVSSCKPTVLVVKAMAAQTFVEDLLQLSQLSFIKRLAISRRLWKLSHGALGSPLPETIQWVGPSLRAIITNGNISHSSANLIRAGFGTSLQRVFYHPVAAGPILANQPYDFQVLHKLSSPLHCGPPSVNVECKLIDVPEPSLIVNDAWKGKLLVRGPSIGVEVGKETGGNNMAGTDLSIDPVGDQDFHQVAEIAQVLSNGTFQILSPSKFGDD